MKKLLSLFLVLTIATYAKAQFGLNLAYTKPSSDFGYVFKPAPAFGLVFYSSTLDERFQLSYGASFASYKARRDTFFSYGTQSGGSGTKYLPAYEVWHNYYLLSLRAQGDYLILDRDFTPTVGLGLFSNTSMYTRDSELKTVINQSELNNDSFLGYMIKAGVLYRINDTYQFKLNAGRVRSRSFKTGVNQSYYTVELEFVIDFKEL
jgi:hypothetical protein